MTVTRLASAFAGLTTLVANDRSLFKIKRSVLVGGVETVEKPEKRRQLEDLAGGKIVNNSATCPLASMPTHALHRLSTIDRVLSHRLSTELPTWRPRQGPSQSNRPEAWGPSRGVGEAGRVCAARKRNRPARFGSNDPDPLLSYKIRLSRGCGNGG